MKLLKITGYFSCAMAIISIASTALYIILNAVVGPFHWPASMVETVRGIDTLSLFVGPALSVITGVVARQTKGGAVGLTLSLPWLLFWGVLTLLWFSTAGHMHQGHKINHAVR